MLGYWRFSGAWKRVTFSGMENQPDRKSLLDAYRVPGFRARSRVDGIGGDPPVFARVHKGEVLLDPRTILEGEEDTLVKAVVEALQAK